jgi:hypothetical protein
MIPAAADRPPWNPSFPPKELIAQCPPAANPRPCPVVAKWLADNTPALKKPDPTLTTREKELARMSAGEYITARRAGRTSCKEYAAVLVKRMVYYKYMNQFMYWGSMPNQTHYIMRQAEAFDAKALASGVESIKPLYGLPGKPRCSLALSHAPCSCLFCQFRSRVQ